MKSNIVIFALLFIFSLSALSQNSNTNQSFYQFKAKTLQGKETSMNDFAGKVVLVVNTASKCGFTPQYEGLENLFRDYKDKGFVILGFPCNQFANQEPGSAEEISKFCTLKYGVNFPMFMKIDVNGENADPLYKFLKIKLPGTLGNDIKWNFTKFLIDRKGNPVKRYAPTTKPEELKDDILKLLAEK